MNLVLNRLDNIKVESKSFELFPASRMDEIKMCGAVVGVNAEYMVNGNDVMPLAYHAGLKPMMGEYMYCALMRKPMILFLVPTQEDEFEATAEELDKRYGMKNLALNNFAQAFSIACWFVKDSCVSAIYSYWINLFNGYYSQSTRFMDISMSDGSITEVPFSDDEVRKATGMMYTVLRYTLPEESRTGDVRMTTSGGTKITEVDRAMSTEGKSFARAFLILQEARKTGVLSTKIDKYCAILECLFAIEGNHKENIANITAAVIGKDETEMKTIRTIMRTAYGVRSDSSHGGWLSFLKKNKATDLAELSKTIDDYVRRVFSYVITQDNLNYDNTRSSEGKVRKHFNKVLIASKKRDTKQEK